MNKNNVLRLWQVVLAVTLWAATMAAPAGAQSTEPFNFSADIAPSVESFKMTQFGSVAPSLYTGAMTYSLPLYTYQDEDFTIPISLEYSYDGYKPSQHSGTVGLGWALNCGGVITREVRGYPDECYGLNDNIRGYFYAQEIFNTTIPWGIYNNKVRYAYNQSPEHIYIQDEDVFTDTPVYTTTNAILYGTNDTRYDPSPDLFHFSMPGYKGDFMCDEQGNLHVFNTENSGTFTVVYDDSSMESPRFIITTGDGYTYYFGGRERGVEYTFSSPDPAYPRTPVAWHLYRMVAPNGNAVDFVYDSQYEEEIDIPFYHPTNIAGLSGDYENGGFAVSDYRPSISCRRHPLLKIIRVNGRDIIRLGYGLREVDESAAECFIRSSEVEPSFFSPFYSSSRRHLNEMDVLDSEGQVIHSVVLTKLFTSQTNESSSRMFLTAVNSTRDGRFGFSYKEITSQTLFPANNTESVDPWGYWSSSRCDSLIKRINTNPAVSLYHQWNDSTYKRATFHTTSKGALTVITYPSGGVSQIHYQQNSVSKMLDRSTINSPFLTDNTQGWQAGGIRVDYIVNECEGWRDTVRYSYLYPGTSQSSGILLQMPRYGTTIQLCHTENFQGSSYYIPIYYTQTGFSDASSYGQPRDPAVGYEYVRECRPDSSSILYHFADYSTFPDTFPGTDVADFLTRTKEGCYDYVSGWGDGPTQSGIAQLLLPARVDFRNLRGLLSSKTEYEAGGHPKRKTSYNYSSVDGFSAESVFNGLIWFVKMRQTFKCPELSSVTELQYEHGDSLGRTTTFSYDTLGRKTQEITMSIAGTTNTAYEYYSNTMTTCPAHLRHALAAVAQTRTDDTGSYLLQTERYTYNVASGNPRPVRVDTYSTDSPLPVSSFTSFFAAPAGYKQKTINLMYDASSHRLLRADLPGGAYLAYTWDPAGKHILSKTVNDSRNSWTYTWKDGFGLSGLSEPTGQALQYYYDANTRLGLVRDGLSRNIESYQYHQTNE